MGVLGDEITNASNVVAKGRLGPGQMVLADIVDGKFAGELRVSSLFISVSCLPHPPEWSCLPHPPKKACLGL